MVFAEERKTRTGRREASSGPVSFAHAAPTVLVLNGWAASKDAWGLCKFPCDGIFSYLDHLNGVTDSAFDAAESVVLVGWSMGGSYALKLAARAPQKVKGLVLVAATPRMMAGSDGWQGMTPRRLAALEMGLRLTLGGGFFGPPEGKPNPYLADSEENLSRGIDYLRKTDLRAELEAARDALSSIPAYIFNSERDGVVRKSNADYLKSIFTDATVEIIPGSEHALPVSIPEKLDYAVKTLCRPSRQGIDAARI